MRVPNALSHAVRIPREIERSQNLLALEPRMNLERNAGKGTGERRRFVAASLERDVDNAADLIPCRGLLTQGLESFIDRLEPPSVRPKREQQHPSDSLLAGGEFFVPRRIVSEQR